MFYKSFTSDPNPPFSRSILTSRMSLKEGKEVGGEGVKSRWKWNKNLFSAGEFKSKMK